MQLREIDDTGLNVTPVAMGCWPIAGITSVGVTEEQSLATLNAALDSGINFFDTAYCYGYQGESEKMIARALGEHRDRLVIATKGGIHWTEATADDGTPKKVQQRDGRPETLRRECEESLRRLNTDRVELYYLHAPDPEISLTDSAAALKQLRDEGKVLNIGVSNFNRQQLEEFAAVCPIAAFQPHYNMLQREIEGAELPWCIEHNVAVIVYWPLMKGLLAGQMRRDHTFDPKDSRNKYPMFQGTEWQRNQDFLDELRPIAEETGTTVAQVVINWTIQQPGITAVLCGAKRPEQITDNAAAMNWKLSGDQKTRISRAIEQRGPIASRSAVR